MTVSSPPFGLEFEICGDSAVLAVSAASDSARRWSHVNAVADHLEAVALPGVYGLIPAFDSILIEFDPLIVTRHTIEAVAKQSAAQPDEVTGGASVSTFTVPAVYGGEHGPDLGEVAATLELSEAEVIELHASSSYTVRMLGGPAGAPMMDGPPFPAAVPRRSVPRVECPAGSIAVAGTQGTMYPFFSPGGWQLIARTPVKVVDIEASPICPYKPGDRIRFTPIDADRWSDYRGKRLVSDDG